jgi:dipeptidase
MTVLIVVFTVVFTILGAARKAEGCFVVVAGCDASATGRVLVGHNEDNRGELIMRHRYFPPASGGRPLFFEDGSAAVQRPDRSLGFFWTETLRPAPGESFGDSFVNELGVAVFSNTCCLSREDSPELVDGGIGWGLRRLVAERARSARDAVRIASDLVLTYGYLGSGRSYTFADSGEAWVFQVVNGKHFAARRVPDDHVTVNPNHYSIREIDPDDPDNCLVSPGLVEYAIKRGWYSPRRPGCYDDFDFAGVFQHPDYVTVPLNEPRRSFGLAAAAGVGIDLGKSGTRPPFSVRPAEPLTFSTVHRTLSCHCERPEDSDERDGALCGAPHAGGGILDGENRRDEYTRICNGSNRESVIVEMSENPDETTIWSCFGNPCVLPMTPWRLGARAVPESFSGATGIVEDEGAATRRHFGASRQDLEREAPEAWSVSRALVERCDADYPKRSIEVREALRSVLREIWESDKNFESSFPHNRESFFLNASSQAGLVVNAIRSLIEE